jgi:DNA-directed RNA polymerase subunit RPC12/RpoP
MIVFKGCNRCEGDLYVEGEAADTDLVCLQCGYRRTIRSSWFEAPAGNGRGKAEKLQRVGS